MMTKDNVKEYIVCINGGSGVIFQPMDQSYSYILTAKHVFDDISTSYENKVNIERYSTELNASEPLSSFELIEHENYFPHISKDVAILKIPRLSNDNKLYRVDNFSDSQTRYSLYGFPNTRRSNTDFLDRLREDPEIRITTEKSNGKYEGKLPDNSNYDELVGQSGGGLFVLKDEYLGLIGIQNKIPTKEEVQGRIEFSPLYNFDEIINENSTCLEPLYPCYMKCFSFLKDISFDLPMDITNENDLNNIKIILRNKANEIINSDIVPLSIKNFFKEKLLVNEREKELLETKAIWRAWLEFLTVLNIVKEANVEEADLPELFNSYCLKYSNTQDDWTYLLKNELRYSDYKGLKDDALVFVGTSKSETGALKIDKGKIPNISSVPTFGDEGRFRTDRIDDPYTLYTFVHTDYLSKVCIMDKLEKYHEITDATQILSLLKEEYHDLFRLK